MVILKNIEWDGSLVRCDIFPEDSKVPGMLLTDTDGNVIEYELPADYEWCKKHVYHAAYALEELYKKGSFPKKWIVTWG